MANAGSKKTGKGRERAKRKLKRSRLERRGKADTQPLLFPQVTVGRIELLKPTAEEPALRRYVPSAKSDHPAGFERLHIVDLREPEKRARCRIRDWGNRIVCGDASASLALVPDATVACVVTSPPYWNTVDYAFGGQLGQTGYEEYLNELLAVWRECERVLIPNGKLCINAPIMPISKRVLSNGHTRELKNLANDIERTILDRLALRRFSLFIWQKQTTEKMFGSYPYPPNLYEQNTVEFINVFVKPGRPRKMDADVKRASRLSEKEWMDLTKQVWWMYPEDIKRARHPAPFPEILPNRLIAMYTFAAAGDFAGDIVLDPFCGTGATCAAAKHLGRRYLGIDLGPDFCVEAAQRIRRTTRDGKVALSGPRGPSSPGSSTPGREKNQT